MIHLRGGVRKANMLRVFFGRRSARYDEVSR
jgi:hypothetical protein